MPDPVIRRYKLEPKFAVAFAVGGVLPMAVAAGIRGWVTWLLITFSALNFLLLIDAVRSGVWLRVDGLDVRPPLVGFPRRVGWRSIDTIWWQPNAAHPGRWIELGLEDDRTMRLPRVKGIDELAAAIEAHTGPIADGRPPGA